MNGSRQRTIEPCRFCEIVMVLSRKMTRNYDWMQTQAGDTGDRPATRAHSFIRSTPSGGRKKGRLALREVIALQGTGLKTFS